MTPGRSCTAAVRAAEVSLSTRRRSMLDPKDDLRRPVKIW